MQRRNDRCNDRPMAAFHFLPPTGHSHRFAARAPCDSKGSECQCGIHTAEAASALRSRKTERAAKEKPTPISHFFFSTCCALAPQLAATPWGGSPPPPPLPENLLLRLHRKLPSEPPASTQRFRNPKIGQQLGAQPTPRFRVMLDPLPPFTFCCPQAIVDEEAGV